MKMRARGCSETSVGNDYYKLRNSAGSISFAAEARNHARQSKSRKTVHWDTDCSPLPTSSDGLSRFTEETQSKRVGIQVQPNLIPSSITTDLSTRDVPLFLLNQTMWSAYVGILPLCQEIVRGLWQSAAS